MDSKKAIVATHLLLRRWGRTLKRSWNLFRQSKLGIAGLILISIFAGMAIFAPLIAPYPEDFLAPEEDVFFLRRYPLNYSEGPQFTDPVVGPSIPTQTQLAGGLWIIVAERDRGIIYMDLGQRPTGNVTPFEVGNVSIELDVTELGLEAPLSNVLYIAQGVDASQRLGNLVFNGLLTFVANDTLVILDPFTPSILFSDNIGFHPRWIQVDPASAGEMTVMPAQSRIGFFRTVGPFRYITVANETHIISYTLEYVRTEIGITSIQRVLDTNATVTGPPLPYNNTKPGLPQSGIFVPSGDKLLVFNVTGGLRSEVNITLGGRPATLTAPIGYTRGEFPYFLFLPVRSDRAAGVLFVAPSNDSVAMSTLIDDPRAEILTPPDPSPAGWVHYAANFEGGTPPARVYRIDLGTALSHEGFTGDMPEGIEDLYFSAATSRLVMLGESGDTYTILTTIGVQGRPGVSPFFERGVGPRQIDVVGSFVGTKYGLLSSEEAHGLYFNPAVGELVIHQFVGSIVAPLPPGTYSSGLRYWLGTDNVGHDILTQLIYGSRIALIVGVLAAVFAVAVGTFVGLVSGYFGGTVDVILMRVTDIALVLPFLAVVLILTSILGPSAGNIILVIALLGWPGIARVIRAQTLSLKERPFVDAARIAGASGARIMFRHLAPNVLPFTFLYMTLFVAGAILTEAALSFLGLGDPRVVTWGIMLSTIQTSGSIWAWWWLLPPGLAITFVSLGFYLMGRAADEIVNPRLRRR